MNDVYISLIHHSTRYTPCCYFACQFPCDMTAAYQLSFAKHIRPTRHGDIVSASRDAEESIGMYESVRRNITSNSATSQKHKDSIWTARHMHLHVLNVSWTVGEYWSRLGLYADPVSERYGYKNSAKGNCEFMTD